MEFTWNFIFSFCFDVGKNFCIRRLCCLTKLLPMESVSVKHLHKSVVQ